MIDKEPPHMWSYWRDKYGFRHALEDYYPGLLETNFMLKQAYYSITTGEACINGIMDKLADECSE